MSHVDLKKRTCRSVDYKKRTGRLVDYKKTDLLDVARVICRMSAVKKTGPVGQSILTLCMWTPSCCSLLVVCTQIHAYMHG